MGDAESRDAEPNSVEVKMDTPVSFAVTERMKQDQRLVVEFDPAIRTSIDIIVPVYKSVRLTFRCLESLAKNIHELATHAPRLLVINDSPGEQDVSQMLDGFARRHSYVTVLENERNLGFVKTVNRGLVLARKDRRDVILVNADTETFPQTLKNLVNVAYADPQIG